MNFPVNAKQFIPSQFNTPNGPLFSFNANQPLSHFSFINYRHSPTHTISSYTTFKMFKRKFAVIYIYIVQCKCKKYIYIFTFALNFCGNKNAMRRTRQKKTADYALAHRNLDFN